MLRRICYTLIAFLVATAPGMAFVFDNIDGGKIDLTQWRGQPVLVVNTASLCGFTNQYSDLQAIYDTYREAGLIVLTVPSDDFSQELDSEHEVKEFCELNYGLDLPMTDITNVLGPQAHPFYKWVSDETGFQPNWNFNKVLLGPDGEVIDTWGATTRPTARSITRAVERLLPG